MPSEDALRAYRDKRDFARTSEPAGGEREPSQNALFVVQKHDASSLHYDVRLEVDGVLKSWAVPKGPSTDPKVRRLAVPTEDHPLEYADFEGVIPEGEYGAGTVLVWDIGSYRNLREEKDEVEPVPMDQAISEGKLEVWLDGYKLSGGYAFIRTGKEDDSRWLLIKMRDEQADASSDIVVARPESVLTGRLLGQIAADG